MDEALDPVTLVGEGQRWTLLVDREMAHPPHQVWAALTVKEKVQRWAPYAPDRSLDAEGPLRLATVNSAPPEERSGAVVAMFQPELLVLKWGLDMLRWQLAESAGGTRLILQHEFARRDLAPSYAAGWHLCLKGLRSLLAGEAFVSMTGQEAWKHGWEDLYHGYARMLAP